MWELSRAARGAEWVTVGNVETVTDAAQKIIALENYPVTGVLFDILIDPNVQTEAESFSYLEHTGAVSKASYVLKRTAPQTAA